MRAADGLEWKHVFWLCGDSPSSATLRNDVKDPPCNGWQHAFVVPGEKRSTIFCPYTLVAYQVSNHSLEIAGAVEPAAPFRHDWAVALILKNWSDRQRLGLPADLDTAALVLRKLGAEVPVIVLAKDGSEDTSSRGGKPVGPFLKKAVPESGKRGVFLKWFLVANGVRSVRETMAEFGMTRSNVLSYLYSLNKDHGLGYDLVGDAARIILPEGCLTPFEEQDMGALPEELDADDSWLD